ncbi:MAG: RHS repeat-associated core domain-containing protein, partial [Chloroflexota bacterium]
NPFRYTGAIWDAATGLYKMGERYYDPAAGRFTQEDPLGGGYGYAGDNPINVSDPAGLRPGCPAIYSCNLSKEHTKGARPSTSNEHDRGQRRRLKDKNGGEKGDKRRKGPVKKFGGKGNKARNIYQSKSSLAPCACGFPVPGLPDFPGGPEPVPEPVPAWGFG